MSDTTEVLACVAQGAALLDSRRPGVYEINLVFQTLLESAQFQHVLKRSMDYSPKPTARWAFSPRTRILNDAVAPILSIISDYYNENCFEEAHSENFSADVDNTTFVLEVRKFPGERDSFGWLSGVHEITLHRNGDKFQFIATWG